MAFLLSYFLCPFNLNFLESGPAVVHEFGFASAVYQVTILTADRANSLALGAANPLHRHAEQHMLAQNIFQLDAAAFIEGDFGFSFINFDFSFVLFARQLRPGDKTDRSWNRSETPPAPGSDYNRSAW